MRKNYKQWLNASVCAMLLGIAPDMMAQSVIFPQAQQAGTAVLNEEGGTYTLSNDLLSAKFFKKGNQLMFEGCKAMNLLPNSELFKIKLADGTTANASEMKLEDVRIINLKGNKDAAKGALRFDGKAIEAVYAFHELKITWRAVLRNGSHYLRTEMDIKAEKDVAMSEITPMIYTVDNIAAGSAPVSVGNTRGAILASNKIFAGLETPMGINTTGSASDLLNFKHNEWNASSFSWNAGRKTPRTILKNGSYNTPNVKLEREKVFCSQGYLTFREAGKQTVTFNYKGGDFRLNIVGVDVVHPKSGKVVASDYHCGYTGIAKDKNIFTLDLPQAGNYMIRYFAEAQSEPIGSNGEVIFSGKVKAPVLMYDLAANAKAKFNSFGTSSEVSGTSQKANALGEDGTLNDSWKATEWKTVSNLPSRIVELGYSTAKYIERPVSVTANRGTMNVEMIYKKGNHGLDIVGVDLIDQNGDAVAYDYHKGFSGYRKENNIYTMNIPFKGDFKLRYFMVNKDHENDCDGDIKVNLAVVDTIHLPAPTTTPINGMWRRNTTLQQGKTWKVSAVIGLMAPEQTRRSVMSYIERERAVPWRAYPIYNSWYELNIDRNNDPEYTTNMNVKQCTNIVEQWKKNLYEKYNTGIQAFVWDDGWDQYGTWTFNKNFPNGLKEPDAAARAMESGTGAWLGPVGGYGQSGNYRRGYWSNKGGMQLSNPDYYKVFYDGCSNLIKNYDFRFFKFDGISAQWSSVGPDAGTRGEENAEGIIYAELDMRNVKPDIFFNTSVGTWASPFWFHITDAVWRQENDWSTIGNQGNDRERWITYRDRLVYQNFVKNSPLCPINCLMTHGFILTEFGAVSKDMSYQSILNELRCAFACGSGMVELYADYKLMDKINNGKLWEDMAECIKWQKKNEDVLPDIHWVGGNPWTGSKSEVYGWASWNGKKATLALRNGQNAEQTYTTTLRKALDIPTYIKTSIKLEKSFSQANLIGIPTGEAIDVDKELTIKFPALSVYVFDGVDLNPQPTF